MGLVNASLAKKMPAHNISSQESKGQALSGATAIQHAGNLANPMQSQPMRMTPPPARKAPAVKVKKSAKFTTMKAPAPKVQMMPSGRGYGR
jgi:hypothetical protein